MAETPLNGLQFTTGHKMICFKQLRESKVSYSQLAGSAVQATGKHGEKGSKNNKVKKKKSELLLAILEKQNYPPDLSVFPSVTLACIWRTLHSAV